MNPQLDLYDNIGAIREALETLLARGKPTSVADLQALVATIAATSRPPLTFPAAEGAQLLAHAGQPGGGRSTRGGPAGGRDCGRHGPGC